MLDILLHRAPERFARPGEPDCLGNLLGKRVRDGDAPRAVIVGFPCDDGVRRNGGRPGAALAPDAIREALYRMLPDPEIGDAFVNLVEHTTDLGDIALSDDIHQDQTRLGEALAPYLAAGALPIVLGGGHETSYGHFLAYAFARREAALLNWDAHADVRELKEGKSHSGSPFRQALLHPSGLARRYTVAGLQPRSVSRTHLDFIAEQGGRWIWQRDLTHRAVDELYDELAPGVLVSFDLDAVDQSQAPGVSAPAAVGMSADLWLHAAERAGRSRAVSSVDVVELNPLVDRDGQTARLAALTVWSVLRGRALADVDATS